MHTAVALLLFYRPDLTQRVFEVIRQARPPKLFLIADGPRIDRPTDIDLCRAARAVVENIDWPCEVYRNYAEINLGMKEREFSGFDWVFSQVNEAIFIEDDCLPDLSFFRFCEELLERYRNDNRIMHIGGSNYQFGKRRTQDSYYFSYFPNIWGWASWRRAWQHFDPDMKNWGQINCEGWLHDLWGDVNKASAWTGKLERTAAGKVSTWDHQWWLSCWSQHGLSILPTVNLVTNIGFDPRGTTYTAPNQLANIPTHPMEFPLSHPPFMFRDRLADEREFGVKFGRMPLWARLISAISIEMKRRV